MTFRDTILHYRTSTDWIHVIFLVFSSYVSVLSPGTWHATYMNMHVSRLVVCFTVCITRWHEQTNSHKKKLEERAGPPAQWFLGLSLTTLTPQLWDELPSLVIGCYLTKPQAQQLEIIPFTHFSYFLLGRKLNKQQMSYLYPIVSEVPTGKSPK